MILLYDMLGLVGFFMVLGGVTEAAVHDWQAAAAVVAGTLFVVIAAAPRLTPLVAEWRHRRCPHCGGQ